MATDPSALIQQLLSPQASNGFQAGQQAYQDRQTQNVANSQALQLGQMKLAQAQQAQAQAQQYQSDVSSYFKDPKPENLAALVAKYPDQAQALKSSYDIMEAPQKESRLTQFGQLYNAAQNGRADLAGQQLDDIISAEQKRGIVDKDAADLRDRVKAGDPDALKQLLAFSQVHLAAASPEFAKTLGIGSDNDNAKAVTFGEGGVGHYEGTKFVVDQQPRSGPTNPKDNYIEIKNADGTTTQHYIGPQGGGDPASSGGASGGRYTGGWTPRQANGGDNPDPVVDNKIAGAAKFLGVSPTADISSMSPAQIAQAMTLSEGGFGTLADRNNNPANLRNSDGSYKSFPTKQAGLSAAAALVARKLKNGQTTVQSLVEGLPIGGQSSGAGGSSRDITGAGPGDTPGIIPDNLTGPPALDYLKSKNPGLGNRIAGIMAGQIPYPSATRKDTQPILNAISQIDPTFDATQWKARNETAAQYAAGGTVGKVLTSGATAVGHLYDVALAAQKLPDHYFGWMNSAEANGAAAGSDTGRAVQAFNRSRTLYAPEVSKYLAGNGQAPEGETRKHYESFDPSLGKTGNLNNLVTDTKFITDKFDQQAQSYQQTMGKPLIIDGQGKTGGPATAKLAALRWWSDNQTSPVPLIARSPAEARSFPSGTVFVTLDGQIRTRH